MTLTVAAATTALAAARATLVATERPYLDALTFRGVASEEITAAYQGAAIAVEIAQGGLQDAQVAATASHDAVDGLALAAQHLSSARRVLASAERRVAKGERTGYLAQTDAESVRIFTAEVAEMEADLVEAIVLYTALRAQA